MEKFMKKSEEKGITLIALIITIIVLIILAGISIMMISGQDGILQRAGNAKTTIGQASAEEAVKRAILSLQIDGKGSNNGITPAKVAEQVNKDNSRSDVVAEGDTFPTNIKFVKDGVNVYVDIDFSVGKDTRKIYSTDIDESQIAPNDLFEYEPITTTGANNTKVASIGDFGSLPEKKIRITGIKSKYLYGILDDYSDKKNYGINYQTEKFTLTDTLIIPYQVEYEGEMYTVTEVNLIQMVKNVYYPEITELYVEVNLPNVENIIYPNTVTKIYGSEGGSHAGNCNVNSVRNGGTSISVQKNIILSENITEIPDGFFIYSEFTNIKLPKKITGIGSFVFYECDNLKTIEFPDGVTEIKYGALSGCDNLKKIVLPASIKSIEGFYDCPNLKKVYYKGTYEQFNEITIINASSIRKHLVTYNEQYEKFKSTLPENEIEREKVLTDMYIKVTNYSLISVGRLSANVRLKTLQETFDAEKNAGYINSNYNSLQEYFENELSNNYLDIEEFLSTDMSIVFLKAFDILDSVPTDETGKWARLTEIFIQANNYQMINNDVISSDTKFNDLQDVWNAWIDDGRTDFTKYNTLKDWYEEIKESLNYPTGPDVEKSIEGFFASNRYFADIAWYQLYE